MHVEPEKDQKRVDPIYNGCNMGTVESITVRQKHERQNSMAKNETKNTNTAPFSGAYLEDVELTTGKGRKPSEVTAALVASAKGIVAVYPAKGSTRVYPALQVGKDRLPELNGQRVEMWNVQGARKALFWTHSVTFGTMTDGRRAVALRRIRSETDGIVAKEAEAKAAKDRSAEIAKRNAAADNAK